MKKDDLVVGSIYAHRESDQPHMLASMQLWRAETHPWGAKPVTHYPAQSNMKARRGTVHNGGTVGRVVLSAETVEELEGIELPGFLEHPYDPSTRADLDQRYSQWIRELPEGVCAELINTTQLEGPYAKVMEQRRKNESARQVRLKVGEEVRDRWTKRYERVRDQLRERGVIAHVRTEPVFSGEDGVYISRPARVELRIEDLEKVLDTPDQPPNEA